MNVDIKLFGGIKHRANLVSLGDPSFMTRPLELMKIKKKPNNKNNKVDLNKKSLSLAMQP